MFSGKTEELLRRIRRAQIANLPLELFKPATDTRYADKDVVSHDRNAMPSTVVASSQALLQHVNAGPPVAVVGVDEAQFFDDGLPDVCNALADRGIRSSSPAWTSTTRGGRLAPCPACWRWLKK